jgi:uncharacterized RDD family membrane protein YckC
MANQYGDPNSGDQPPYGQAGGGQPGYGQPGPGQWPGYQPGPGAQPGGYAYGPPPYVSWFSRVGSYILDYLVPWILFAAGNSIRSGAIKAIFDLIGLGWIIWNRWFRAGRTGQSVGKTALKSRLVDERTGQPIGAGMAFARDIVHLLDAVICYVGFLFPLWDKKRQTIADKLLHTVVVRSDGGQPSYPAPPPPPGA